jgi:hypothetical protein
MGPNKNNNINIFIKYNLTFGNKYINIHVNDKNFKY